MAKAQTLQIPQPPESDSIADLLSNLTPSEDWIELYRIDTDGREYYRCRYRVEDFDLDRVRNDHGGGRFCAAGKDGATKRFKGGRMYFTIDGAPMPIRSAAQAPAQTPQQWGAQVAFPAVPDPTTALLAEIRSLREEVSTLRQGATNQALPGVYAPQQYGIQEMIRREIRDAIPQQPRGLDWASIISAIPGITALMNVLRPPTNADEAMRIVTTILQMRGEPVAKESSFSWKDMVELAKSPAATQLVAGITEGLAGRSAASTLPTRRVVQNTTRHEGTRPAVTTNAPQAQKEQAWRSPHTLSSSSPSGSLRAASSDGVSSLQSVRTSSDAPTRTNPALTENSQVGSAVVSEEVRLLARMLMAGAESEEQPDPQEAAQTIVGLIDPHQIGEYLAPIPPGRMVEMVIQAEPQLAGHTTWLAMIEGVLRERTIEVRIEEDAETPVQGETPPSEKSETPPPTEVEQGPTPVAEQIPQGPQPDAATPAPAAVIPPKSRTRGGTK